MGSGNVDLQMRADVAEGYTSSSQKIRVITEDWVSRNMYCPCCGNPQIQHYENNRPVADFFCPQCQEEYELKSKAGAIGTKICDGAYNTMISRINSICNPNFFFMHYGKVDLTVHDLIMVPKHFFTPDIIEQRKPLAQTARRAGWVGCNIAIQKIPQEGKIYLIKNKKQMPVDDVLNKLRKTRFIAKYGLEARGWILDIFNCVNRIPCQEFALDDLYAFENELQRKHPQNHHVKDKIRQQLQLLRDKGLVEFRGRGNYRKIE